MLTDVVDNVLAADLKLGGRMTVSVEPFLLTVPDAELDELRARLSRTRWPDPETDHRQGFALEDLQSLCAYWAGEYDWRVVEERLNAVGQYTTVIDGLVIHFLHAHSSQPGAVPLLLTHGWPGSVIEYLDVLGPLTAAGFHCVVPPFLGTAGAASPAGPAGAYVESPMPGRRSWRGSDTTATSRRAGTGAPA